ncbi:hypothetical protein GCM10020331_065310 [Ectobacillus funiculus]
MPILGLGLAIQTEEDYYQPTFQAYHHQFVASARAVQLCHEMIPGAQIGCMIVYIPTYAGDCNPENVLYALKEEQLFNYFCGDVQVRGEYPTFIKRYWKEHGIKLEIQEGDLELIKENTVDYIAF